MSKRKLIVGFDIDEVLAEFDTVFCERLGVTVPKGWEPKHWDYAQREFGLSDTFVEAVWSGLDDSFWLNLMPQEGVKYAKLCNPYELGMPVDRVFITARKGVNALEQTSKWLEKHQIFNSSIIISPHKGAICKLLNVDFYIDDNLENAVDFYHNTGRRAYLLDRLYNRTTDPISESRVMRIKSVEEYYNSIKGYVKIL